MTKDSRRGLCAVAFQGQWRFGTLKTFGEIGAAVTEPDTLVWVNSSDYWFCLAGEETRWVSLGDPYLS